MRTAIAVLAVMAAACGGGADDGLEGMKGTYSLTWTCESEPCDGVEPTIVASISGLMIDDGREVAAYFGVDCEVFPDATACAENPLSLVLLADVGGAGMFVRDLERTDDGGYIVPDDIADGPVGTTWGGTLVIYAVDADTIEGGGTFDDGDGSPETFSLVAVRAN